MLSLASDSVVYCVSEELLFLDVELAGRDTKLFADLGNGFGAV